VGVTFARASTTIPPSQYTEPHVTQYALSSCLSLPAQACQLYGFLSKALQGPLSTTDWLGRAPCTSVQTLLSSPRSLPPHRTQTRASLYKHSASISGVMKANQTNKLFHESTWQRREREKDRVSMLASACCWLYCQSHWQHTPGPKTHPHILDTWHHQAASYGLEATAVSTVVLGL
jgi:hypothetical protein